MPGRIEADDEQRVAVAEPEQPVERHHEASLRLGTAPGTRNAFELVANAAIELARPQRPRRVAGVLEPVHGLAHLANRAALEREGLDVDHRLVSVVEGMQPVPRVQRQPTLGGSEDRDPPVALVRVGDEQPQELVERLRRADRVARDDRHAAQHPVGEKRRLLRPEEVRLVGPEHERRERVHSPRAHQRRCELALAMPLEHAVPPRREPGRDDPERHRDPEQEEREREPLTEVAVEVRGAADMETDQASRRLSSSEPEGERLVGVDAVDPQHRKRIGGDDGRARARAAAPPCAGS